MPITRCPHCDVPLTAEEQLRVTCPSCHEKLDRPAPVRVSAKDVDWEDEALPVRKPRDRRAVLGWGTVRAALALTALGLVLLLGPGTGLIVLLRLVKEPHEYQVYLRLALTAALALGVVLLPVGQLMCAAVPALSRARGFATVFVLLAVLMAGVGVALFYNQVHKPAPRLGQDDQPPAQAAKGGGMGMGKMQPPPREPPAREPLGETVVWSLWVGLYGLGILAHAFFTATLFQISRHLQDGALGVSLLLFLCVSLVFASGVVLLYAVRTFPNRRDDLVAPLPDWASWSMLAVAVLLLLWELIQVLWTRGIITRAMLRGTG
jgi:hypothetical protein